MARPRTVSDEQILEAVRQGVVEHGPSVSLDVIAEGLSVTAPALFKRFGSRHALLLAALRPPENPKWLASLSSGPDERPLADQLEAVFGQVSEFFGQMMPCVMALRESGISHEEIFRDAKSAMPLRSIRALTQWLGRAKEKGLLDADELESASTAMIGAIQTRAFIAHLTKQPWSGPIQRGYHAELARFFSRALDSHRVRRKGHLRLVSKPRGKS